MYEALKNTDCEQILFMDDDIRIEPDSILRALAFNRFAKIADAGRRSDAQPAGAVAPARHGRDGRPGELHVDQRAVNTEYDHNFAEVPAERRRAVPQQAAAPPHRRRLQRLVDVHDPARGRRGARPAAAAVHQVGRRRIRAARRRTRLPDRHAARCGDLAHGVERQGRRHRLAGLLPPAQPAGGRRHALGRQHHAAWSRSHLKATIKHLLCLEYSTVAIQNKAMDDFLAGPEHIFSILESALPDGARDAPGVPRRGGAAERDRAADAVGQAVAQEGADPRQPAGDRGAAGPRRAPPAQGARSAAPRAPADQRRHPGRALVLAVATSTASPSPPPTAAASSTASATARRCSSCCANR